jgi:glycosyltransferase involved in cell wall biosynthesis
MKILHVSSVSYLLFKSSGSAKVAYELSNKLSSNGHKVYLFATDKHKRDDVKKVVKINNNFIVYHCNLLFRRLAYKYRFYVIPYIDQEVLSEKVKSADIVHVHDYRSLLSIYATKYAQKYDVPYVLQAHGSLPRVYPWQKLKWLYDELFGYKLLRDTSKVIALTQVEAEQYKRMGVPEEKIAIIPNGIDFSEYAELPPKGAFKRKFGVKEEEKIVLYLGRIHRSKGIDFLIKSFSYLVKNGTENVKLVIAGPDDGYMREARSLANSLGLGCRVLFTGALSESDKISAYVDSNITVNVESRNVYGLVPLEAAACSTPVIVSKGNAISEIVNRGEFGFSVDYGDVAELSDMMNKLICDDALRQEMGRRGRDFVSKNLSWKSIIVKIEKVYEEVIAH